MELHCLELRVSIRNMELVSYRRGYTPNAQCPSSTSALKCVRKDHRRILCFEVHICAGGGGNAGLKPIEDDGTLLVSAGNKIRHRPLSPSAPRAVYIRISSASSSFMIMRPAHFQ
jgi:hypothetical protein